MGLQDALKKTLSGRSPMLAQSTMSGHHGPHQIIRHRGQREPRSLGSPFNLEANKTTLLKEITAGLLGWLAVTTSLSFYAKLFVGEEEHSLGATVEGFMLVAGVSTILMGCIANLPIIVAPSVLYASSGSLPLGGFLAAQFISNIIAAMVIGSMVHLVVVSNIPSALRVGVGCGISTLVSVLGLRSMGILERDSFELLDLDWKNIMGLLVVTFSCIPWTSKYKWHLVVGIPILITMVAYAISDESKFDGYQSGTPLSDWDAGTVGALSFGEVTKDPFNFGFYIVRTSVSIVINVSSILLVLLDAICLQDMRKVFKAMDREVHEIIGTTQKFRIMAFLVPILSMAGNLLGTTTQAVFVQSMVCVLAGARTGLSTIVTGVCFLLSMVLWPLHEVLAPGHVTGALTILMAIRSLASIRDINLAYPPNALALGMPILLIPFSFNFVDGLSIAMVMTFICEQGMKISLWREIHLTPDAPDDVSYIGQSHAFDKIGSMRDGTRFMDLPNVSHVVKRQLSYDGSMTAEPTDDGQDVDAATAEEGKQDLELDGGAGSNHNSTVPMSAFPESNVVAKISKDPAVHPAFALIALLQLVLTHINNQR
ncbi:unnamed protein product [Discosporangium mesarthrocarpum]